MAHRVFASRSDADVVEPADVLDRIVAEALVLIDGADGASIEARRGELLEYVSGAGTLARFVGLTLRIDGSLSGLCLTSGEVVRCNDALDDARVDPEAVRITGIRSMVCVPLRVSGRVDAVLKMSAATPHAFTDADADELRRLAEVLSIAVTAAADLAEMSEQRLALADQLVELADAEQRRLALALHDDPVQRLSAALYQVAILRASVTDEPLAVVQRIEALVQGAVVSLRRMMFEFAPPDLDPTEFGEVLESAADQLFADSDAEVTVDVRCDRVPDLPEAQLLYRIAIEALGNARRHAAAGRVTLRVRTGTEGTTLEVADDGVGFDTHAVAPGHLGLHSLRERSRLLGGTASIDSTPGTGTTVTVRVPPVPAA